MNIKRELYNYPYLAEQRNELQKRIDSIENNKYVTLQSPILGQPRGSGYSDQTADAAMKILITYQESIIKLQNHIIYLTKKEEDIRDKLTILDSEEYKVIELRYFKRLNWNDVSKRMHYSKRQCFRKTDIALNKLSKELERCRNELC